MQGSVRAFVHGREKRAKNPTKLWRRKREFATKPPLPRRPRVQYAGAIYHVFDRGDRREPIFLTDADRDCFLDTLAESCDRTGWRGHSYVLMHNHYHLL